MSDQAQPRRRTRGEIDRDYFFGDVFIKTGVAVAFAAALIALYTSGTLLDKVHDGEWDYLTVMGVFVGIGAVLFFAGRHLRKTATHWDLD